MFRKLLLVLAMLFISSDAFCQTKPLVLEKANTITLQGEVTGRSVSRVISEFYKMNKALPGGQPIYLYLNTPGGSVEAGMVLVNYFKSTGREVKTITAEAASMGFVIVQGLGERLVLKDGVLMMHRASTQISGHIPGELHNRTHFDIDYIRAVEDFVSTRLGLNYKDYSDLVHDEYWQVGQKAVDQNAADKVVSVTCGTSLQGSHKEVIQVFIFSLDVEFADCPLVSTPLSVSAADKKLQIDNPVLFNQAMDFINKTYFNDMSNLSDIQL